MEQLYTRPGTGGQVKSLVAFAQEHPKIPKSWSSAQQAGRGGQPQGQKQRRGVGRLKQVAAQTSQLCPLAGFTRSPEVQQLIPNPHHLQKTAAFEGLPA